MKNIKLEPGFSARILVLSIVVPLLCLVSSRLYFFFTLGGLKQNPLQLWRLFTSLFVCRIGYTFPLMVFNRYKKCEELEKKYLSKSGFVRFVVFCVLLSFPIAFILKIGSLWTIFDVASTYLWSKFNYDVPVSIYGFSIQAQYVPYVLLAASMILNGEFMESILGLVVGAFYCYCKFDGPREIKALL